MKMNEMKKTSSNAGNALWFILIAIALLGILTAMMTRTSTETEETGDMERATISVSQIMGNASGMSAIVNKLLLSGCAESQLNFKYGGMGHTINSNAPTDGSCDVYGAGGGLPDRGLGTNFSTRGDHTVIDVGTAEPELIFVTDVTRDQCISINRTLGIVNDGSEGPPDDIFYGGTYFTGTHTAPVSDDQRIENPAFSQKKAGCMHNGGSGSTALFLFYTVLVAH